MKSLFKRLFMLLVAVAAMSACSDDESYTEPQLEVTRHNISGVWSLQTWNGGALAEGSYVYIKFERADRTYTMWQNVDSAPARKITGMYNIEIDAELGAVIRGNYDYGNGDWAHRYIVTSLTADEMIWVAKDDATDVSIYVRAELPEEFQTEE
ncbi:MAG: lipocalin family protein [Alistipes sp.]|nr:lipocalin family protein [Alistipes sp.]